MSSILERRLIGKVFNSLKVDTDAFLLTFSDGSGFAIYDRLSLTGLACDTASVTAVEYRDGKTRLEFDGHFEITLSSLNANSTGPEAWVFQDVDGQYIVEN